MASTSMTLTPSGSIERLERLKDEAKALVARAGVPVARGYEGDVQDAASLQDAAQAIGYPVLIKLATWVTTAAALAMFASWRAL